jgi:hypothetical protein
MKKLFLSATVLALFGLAVPAQAGFVDTLVKNTENQYEDESRDHVFFQNGKAGLQVGDVIVGFVQLKDRSHPAPGVTLNNTVYGIFSEQIKSISGNTIQFGATASGNAESLQSILGNSSGISSGAIFALYDRPQGNPFPHDLINTSGGNKSINAYLQQIAGNGTLEATAGIVAANDFLTAQTALAPSSITATLLNKTPSGVTVANFAGGLSIIDNNTGINFATDVIGQDFNAHQLVITKGAVTGGTNNTLYKTFGKPGVEDNATFLVHPQGVSGPEPATFVLMAMGITSLAGGGYLRRRKTVGAA